MGTLSTTKIKTKLIPLLMNGGLFIAVPFDIPKDKLVETIDPYLKGHQNEEAIKKEIFKIREDLNKETSEYYLINQMVSTIVDISQDLVNKASFVADKDVKTMCMILARTVSSFSSAQLLFNFSYYIEFITILRMVYEQCGYVVSWADKGEQPKKGPQSIQTSKFQQFVPSANTTLYGELAETAHLDIHKARKHPGVKNEYEDGNALVLASHTKTKENYHIFEEVFLVLVDTLDYFINKFFSDDLDLLKYLEVVKLNRFCITSISQKGYIDDAEILKEFPNIKEDAFNGLDQESQKLMLEKFGSVDNFWEVLKNSHR